MPQILQIVVLLQSILGFDEAGVSVRPMRNQLIAQDLNPSGAMAERTNTRVRLHRSFVGMLHKDSRLWLLDARSEFYHTHLMRKGLVRNPLGAGPGASLFQHSVDLFQSETLCLRNDEVGEQKAEEKGATPYEENLRLEVSIVHVNEVGCDDGDDAVP